MVLMVLRGLKMWLQWILRSCESVSGFLKIAQVKGLTVKR